MRPMSCNRRRRQTRAHRTVFCKKFEKEMPGLDAPPWPGELGQRIYENISAEAWKLWEERMKMILNEYRLMPWQKEAQELVQEAHGGLLLRRRRGAAARIRAAAGQSRSIQTATRATVDRARRDRSRTAAGVCASRSAASAAAGCRRAREDESQIAAASGSGSSSCPASP